MTIGPGRFPLSPIQPAFMLRPFGAAVKMSPILFGCGRRMSQPIATGNLCRPTPTGARDPPKKSQRDLLTLSGKFAGNRNVTTFGAVNRPVRNGRDVVTASILWGLFGVFWGFNGVLYGF